MRSLFLTLFVATLAAPAHAAPPPDPAALCALILAHRPTEQLRDRSTCTLERVLELPKGSSMRRAVLVRAPFDSAVDTILMLEVDRPRAAPKAKPTAAGTPVPSSWVDQGPVARDAVPRDGVVERATLHEMAVHVTALGPVLDVVSTWEHEIQDQRGVASVSRREHLLCAFAAELICVAIAERLEAAARGDVPGFLPAAWSRTVDVSESGEIVISARQGPGDLPVADPGPGRHAFASFSDWAFIRRYPHVPLVHPDQVEDVDLPTP